MSSSLGSSFQSSVFMFLVQGAGSPPYSIGIFGQIGIPISETPFQEGSSSEYKADLRRSSTGDDILGRRKLYAEKILSVAKKELELGILRGGGGG